MPDMSTPESGGKRHLPWKKIVGFGLLGLIGLFLLIQLIPYGRTDHTNPPVTKAAVFSDPKARQIVAASCDDCHSNLTRWPWYTNVAPASWLVQQDVDEGRSKMNLSEWDKPQPALDEVIRQIQPGGEMPPWKYTVMPNHADARLSDADRAILIKAFRELYAKEPPGGIKAGGGG